MSITPRTPKKKRTVEVWAQCSKCLDSFSLVLVCIRDEAMTIEANPRLEWGHEILTSPNSDDTRVTHTILHHPLYCNGKVALFGSLETILEQYPQDQQKRILARGILPRANAASFARRMAPQWDRALRADEGNSRFDARDTGDEYGLSR